MKWRCCWWFLGWWRRHSAICRCSNFTSWTSFLMLVGGGVYFVSSHSPVLVPRRHTVWAFIDVFHYMPSSTEGAGCGWNETAREENCIRWWISVGESVVLNQIGIAVVGGGKWKESFKKKDKPYEHQYNIPLALIHWPTGAQHQVRSATTVDAGTSGQRRLRQEDRRADMSCVTSLWRVSWEGVVKVGRVRVYTKTNHLCNKFPLWGRIAL